MNIVGYCMVSTDKQAERDAEQIEHMKRIGVLRPIHTDATTATLVTETPTQKE